MACTLIMWITSHWQWKTVPPCKKHTICLGLFSAMHQAILQSRGVLVPSLSDGSSKRLLLAYECTPGQGAQPLLPWLWSWQRMTSGLSCHDRMDFELHLMGMCWVEPFDEIAYEVVRNLAIVFSSRKSALEIICTLPLNYHPVMKFAGFFCTICMLMLLVFFILFL